MTKYLDKVEKGELVVASKRGRNITEIRPITPRATEMRPIGLAKGTFLVPASFFEELPDDTIALFSGEAP